MDTILIIKENRVTESENEEASGAEEGGAEHDDLFGDLFGDGAVVQHSAAIKSLCLIAPIKLAGNLILPSKSPAKKNLKKLSAILVDKSNFTMSR